MLKNLNSKKLILSGIIVIGLTAAMILEKITGMIYAEKMMMVFMAYMAIDMIDKKVKNGNQG